MVDNGMRGVQCQTGSQCGQASDDQWIQYHGGLNLKSKEFRIAFDDFVVTVMWLLQWNFDSVILHKDMRRGGKGFTDIGMSAWRLASGNST